VFSVLDQVAEVWPRTRVGWAFTEPSIYPHLLETLAHAQRRGVRTSMTTNGWALPKLAEGLRRTGLEVLNVSLDGPADVHDAVRGRKGAFERAVEGIRAVRHGGHGPTVFVHCCITPWGAGRLGELMDALVGLDVAGVGFMHPNFTPQAVADAHNRRFAQWRATASNVADMDPTGIDLDALLVELQSLRARGATFSPDLRARDELETFYRRPDVPVGRRCLDAFATLEVKSDGTVIPAHGRCYRVVAGNAWDTPLPELWNAPELRRFRRDLTRAGGLLPACSRCCSSFK
jgi:MoaA/NifB/PqqE/SkfB family radical SAM enzyme